MTTPNQDIDCYQNTYLDKEPAPSEIAMHKSVEELELIYATPEQIGLANVVLSLDKTLSRMMLYAIISFISIAFCFYHLTFELGILVRHQKIMLTLLFLVQSSVMANTFIVKQTLVHGNLIGSLQITTELSVDENTRRGHLLFISSLYNGSLRVTFSLAVSFLACILYIYNVTEMSLDFFVLATSIFFIVPNVLSAMLVYSKNKVVRDQLKTKPL